MRVLYTFLLAACLGLVAAAAQAAPKPQAVDTPAKPQPESPMSSDLPQVIRLSNGLTVVVLEDTRFPLVSTRLYVHAGSTYEKPDEAGISHVLEHMVFKGTQKRPKGAVAAEVEAAGGYLNAATSFDYTMYLTDMPAKHWKLGMDVVRDMAFHPTLDPAELESEKDVIVAELKRGKDSPRSLLFESMQEHGLAGTPYARPIIGFENTIRNLTVQTIRSYIDTYYQPQSMVLLVVGDVKAAEVLAEAEATFGVYTNRGIVDMPPLLSVANVTHPVPGNVSVIPGAWNKVYLSMALPVPGSDDVRSTQLDVLGQLLGGDQTSRFWRAYKYEKQLVDSISVANMSFERLGLFFITAELDADKVEPFWKALTADLAALKADMFSDADIARAKLNMEDDLFRAKETLSGLASKLGYFQFFTGDGVMGERNAIQNLRDVDRAQLQESITAWLNPNRLSTTLLVPHNAALPPAEALAATLHAQWPTPAHKALATADARKGKTEIITLGQGRTLVLIPDATLPYVSADMAFTGGDALLTPDQQGLAALTARTLTRGTGTRNAVDMQIWLGDRAASLGASAGRQSFSLSLHTPSAFSGDLFALLDEVLRTPAFAPEEVAREKQAQAAAIRSRDDQALGYAFRRLPAFLFPGSVFGYYQLGQEKELMAYTPEQVRAYWTAQRAQPWVLAVAGQYDREAVIAAAKALPASTAKAVRPAAPAWGKDMRLDLTLPGRQQAHYLMLFKTVPLDHPDAPGLELLQNILAGQSGLLFRDLRDDKGLGYTVTAFNSSALEYGYMAFYIGTEPGKVAEAQAGFDRVIADLHAKPLPEAEIARGKNQMEGDYYRARQSLGSRSGEAASLTLIDKPLSFSREQIDKAAKLSAADLQAIAKKYLNSHDAYTVSVLP